MDSHKALLGYLQTLRRSRKESGYFLFTNKVKCQKMWDEGAEVRTVGRRGMTIPYST